MRKTNIKLLAGALLTLFTVSSCEDQLNINDNPNQPITADVELVLPQAITASASIASQFNNYGGHFGGYIANAGGFSGFGNLLNYNLTPGDYNGLWVNTYQDPLKDLKYVIDNTAGLPEYAYFHAAAEIMTVVNYQRLVDAFGDVPYSEALRGEENIMAPAYDDAATIYQDLYARLNAAIAELAEASNQDGDTDDPVVAPLVLGIAADPLFSEAPNAEAQATYWARYANTLKLRMLLRLSGKSEFSSFVSAGFAEINANSAADIYDGSPFITNDAIIDPGYELNRPNPAWATWGRTVALALANSSRVPTSFSFGFYGGSGAKITDFERGEATFVNYPTTPTNQLGNEVNSAPIVSGQVTWAPNQAGYTGLGVLKGPAMGQPIMLLAEAKFLQAEAVLKNFLTSGSTAQQLFDQGITASFQYLFKNEGESIVIPAPNTSIAQMVADYKTDNPGNYLVDYAAATTDEQRLEAIITQKYIAMTMITSDESYNEFRRTGYPRTSPGGSPVNDIASNKSAITSRFDRLPTRVMYPSSEQSYNATNYVAIDYTSQLIFWDPN